jgi:hypothetical protein
LISELTAEHYSDVGLLLSSCSEMISAKILAALDVSARQAFKQYAAKIIPYLIHWLPSD